MSNFQDGYFIKESKQIKLAIYLLKYLDKAKIKYRLLDFLISNGIPK